MEGLSRRPGAGSVQPARHACADVDPRAFGLGLEAMISVRLKQHSRDQFEAFRLNVQSLPEVVAGWPWPFSFRSRS